MCPGPDQRECYTFTGRARLDNAINSLVGLVEGISIDGVINSDEVGFLSLWLSEYTNLRDSHPFTELMPVKAVELRKQGARILLVHENDFHDAVVDLG